jgi:mRNA interferase RelE/StbE
VTAQLIVGDDLLAFIVRQAPEPRRALREGLRRLAREEGDIKALQGDLEGYHRLRVGNYRVIFCYESRPQRAIHCLLIERRALVYQVFADMVKDRLAERAETAVPLGKPQPVSYKKTRPKPKPPAQAKKKPAPAIKKAQKKALRPPAPKPKRPQRAK